MSAVGLRRSAELLSRRVLFRRVVAFGLSAPLVGAVLSACGSPTPAGPGSAPASTAPATAGAAEPNKQPASAGQPAAAKPKRGGTLRAVVVSDFTTMWPMLATGRTAVMCCDWLVRWRKGADGRWA